MPSKTLVAPIHATDDRLAWRRSLTEGACRELAADYIAALSRAVKAGGTCDDVDASLFDAHEEYLERYAEEDAKLGQSVRNKTKRSQRATQRRTSLYR